MRLKEAEKVLHKIPYADKMLAMKTPVCEAENAIDDRSPLGLYDCLIPKLKEQHVFRVNKLTIEDFNTQMATRLLEKEIR